MVKKYILRREKYHEDSFGVPLWFETKNQNIIVSVVGGKGNVRMRLSTPSDFKEVGYPFADFSKVKEMVKDYARSAERILKEMGYNAKVKEGTIKKKLEKVV
jgi:hypothetical protein